MSEAPIGFIGLGRMGQPMARNLLGAGYKLTVYDIVPERMKPLIEAGASPSASCREAAEGSRVVITIVADSPDVEKAVLGQDGVIQGMSTGSALIEMSTIAPGVGRRVAAALAEKGVAMLDCPVSGGPQGAGAGTLSIMAGGPKEVSDECLLILRAMGERIEHFGDTGSGYMAKLCNYRFSCVTVAAVTQENRLCRRRALR